jgi:hypothetical protein
MTNENLWGSLRGFGNNLKPSCGLQYYIDKITDKKKKKKKKNKYKLIKL